MLLNIQTAAAEVSKSVYRLPWMRIRCILHAPEPSLSSQFAQSSRSGAAAAAMSAFVSAFLVLAFARMTAVDHLWWPQEDALEVDAFPSDDGMDEQPIAAQLYATEMVQAKNEAPIISSRKKKKRNSTTKKNVPQNQPIVELVKKAEVETPPVSSDCRSDASTCASSDEEEEEEVEDLGEREMKLMLERVQQIKKLTQQSRHTRPTRKKSVSPPRPPPEASHPDVCAPIRLRNATNTLWRWSVFSGFAVDRSPLDSHCFEVKDHSRNDGEDVYESEVYNRVLQVLNEE